MSLNKLLASSAPSATVIIRLMVGLVFLSEGLQKFLFVHELGVGRLTKMGVPAPEVMAPFVGCCEILCGTLLCIGLLTRLATLPLFGVMIGAFIFSRIPEFAKVGFWAGLHGGRTDYSMWMGLLFLLIVGAGPVSLDKRLLER